MPAGWKARNQEEGGGGVLNQFVCCTGRTYHFISDTWITNPPPDFCQPSIKTNRKIPLGWPRISRPPIPYSSHSFLWRGPPLTQQPKEDALFASLLPHTCHCLSSQKRLRWWGDCRLSFAEPTAALYCEAVISVKNKFVGANKAASCGATKHNKEQRDQM